MNYPYATLYFNTKRAKQRLTRFFLSEPEHKPTVSFHGSPKTLLANDQREGADQPRQSQREVLQVWRLELMRSADAPGSRVRWSVRLSSRRSRSAELTPESATKGWSSCSYSNEPEKSRNRTGC